MVRQVVDWSTSGLVNLPKYLMENTKYIIAISVISGRLHYFYLVHCQYSIWQGLGLVYKYRVVSL